MPKLQTYRKWLYSGSLYNYEITSDPEGNDVYNYSFARNIKLDLSQGVFGKINLFFPNDCDDVLAFSRVQNLSDRSGNELYPGGVWTLTGIMPVINVFGQREGFRGQATLNKEPGIRSTRL